MPNHAVTLKKLKAFGPSLPGTQPKSPWPGHDDVAVNNKTFVYLSVHDGKLSVSTKLQVSGKVVLELPNSKPTGYGLGKSGWVTVGFNTDEPVILDTVMHWMMESYRAQAPKRLLKELEAAQPWVKAGELPDPRHL
ncbi:MAG: MmcQ/YjbR family DNA-binding protein [Pseudomonadota bacterium]